MRKIDTFGWFCSPRSHTVSLHSAAAISSIPPVSKWFENSHVKPSQTPDYIYQAVPPRTHQTYWKPWRSFKIFHRAQSMFFPPEFPLLSISSITYLNQSNTIKPRSIKVYLSVISFSSLSMANRAPTSQTLWYLFSSKIYKKTKINPPCPDTIQPLTIDLLSFCLTTVLSTKVLFP